MPGRIGFQFPHDRDAPREELLGCVRLADELGYDTIFVPEAWSRDAFSTLGWIAANTRHARLGPGVVNIFSRTPALIAQSIASLDEISGGRAVLGLGISGPLVIENWHGLRFDRPLRRTREAVEIIRLALDGARVDYTGEVFELKNFRLGFKPLRERIPIYIASLGPKNNALTGQIADGWLPIWLPLGSFRDALQEVNAPVDVAPTLLACVIEDRKKGYDLVRPHLSYYIGGMGTFYRNMISRFGLSAQASQIHALWQSGKRREAVAAVSDEMVEKVALVGNRDECRERLEEYRRAGATLPVIAVPHGASREVVEKTLEALA